VTVRAAHGNARRLGAVAVVETLPLDELPAASPEHTARPERKPNGQFAEGNTVARRAKTRSSEQGELAALERQAEPAWQAADRWSKTWRRGRIKELEKLHSTGKEGLSRDALAHLEDARQAMRDARWCASKGASLESTDSKRAGELRREASQLRLEARGHRMAAWEYAAKEAGARPHAREGYADRKRRELSATATPVTTKGNQ
jgi:hypothetical protein